MENYDALIGEEVPTFDSAWSLGPTTPRPEMPGEFAAFVERLRLLENRMRGVEARVLVCEDGLNLRNPDWAQLWQAPERPERHDE